MGDSAALHVDMHARPEQAPPAVHKQGPQADRLAASWGPGQPPGAPAGAQADALGLESGAEGWAWARGRGLAAPDVLSDRLPLPTLALLHRRSPSPRRCTTRCDQLPLQPNCHSNPTATPTRGASIRSAADPVCAPCSSREDPNPIPNRSPNPNPYRNCKPNPNPNPVRRTPPRPSASRRG